MTSLPFYVLISHLLIKLCANCGSCKCRVCVRCASVCVSVCSCEMRMVAAVEMLFYLLLLLLPFVILSAQNLN